MSSASTLVVPGAPAHTDDPIGRAYHLSGFFPRTQFQPHQSSSNHMEPSNAFDGASGFPKSNAQNQNFAFNTSSASALRPASGLSRPRFVKVRKQNNAQNLKPPGMEENRVASGFNPFCSIRDDSVGLFSGSRIGSSSTFSEIDVRQTGNEAFVFGTRINSSGSNLNMGGNLDQGIVDRMRSLKMSNVNEVSNVKDEGCKKGEFAFEVGDKNSSSHDENLVAELPEDIRKLNIGGNDDIDKTKGRGLNIYADEHSNFTSCSKDNTSGGSSSVQSELPNELAKKLSIKATHKAEDSSAINNSTSTVLCQMKNLNLKDSLGSDDVHKNEADVMAYSKNKSASASRKTTPSYVGRRTETTLLRKMEKLKVVNEKADSTKPNFWIPSSQVSVGDTNQTDASGDQLLSSKPEEDIRMVQNVASSSSLLSRGIDFPTVGNTFGIKTKDEFVFTGKKDGSGLSFAEFKTPASNANLFGSVDEKWEFNAKKEQISDTRMKKRRGKVKLSTPTQQWHVHNLVSKEKVSQDDPEDSEAYSPMDVSPYQETLAETRCSRENSVTSHESLSFDNSYTAADSEQTTTNDLIDEDLIVNTERLIINECNAACEETKEHTSEYQIPKSIFSEDSQGESISGVEETQSFKSANDKVDITSDASITSAETKSSPSSSIEAGSIDRMLHLDCASSSSDISGFPFTFAASSSAEAQLSSPKRHPKKKNWVKVGYDTHSTTPSLNVSYSSPSMAFSSCSGTSSLFISGQGHKAKVSTSQPKTMDSEINRVQLMKEDASSVAATSIAAQEACEKWRLRGNQAYKNGDLSMAEDCYTKGLKCVSNEETSRNSLRALMLCYSNRAATRMSLGRMRDALEDCILAAEIDPYFLRVQLRAANCYLALGEVGEALQYFRRCLQSGTDICVDRKIAVEASDGLQKAQKVSEFINHSSELLQRRTTSDADRALEQINEALLISSYSEKLLEMKVEALFMLCKYEEVIQLCDQTLPSAEKNFQSLDAYGDGTNLNNSQISKRFNFRLWRSSMKLKSYFHLGKLEEGLSSLEEQREIMSSMNKTENNVFDLLIPLAVTVRELLHHKNAGNEAFQAGRHAEAVEHYTAALSCNVESRPFVAVCFCNRAAAYKALGQITDAIADCSLAIALDGKYLKALSRRATLYEMIRDYAQAASDLQRLVSHLNKIVEDKGNQIGICDRPIAYANDLKQNRIRLSEIEEEAKKEIPLDMYLILGVEPSVSTSEIKKAYRKAALRHHPDKAGQFLARGDNGDDGMWKDIAEEVRRDADRLFKIIGEAYAMLSDPAKRARYDAEEEMRNSQKKRHESSMTRTNVDTQSYPFEQSNPRYRREVFRSYGNSSSRGSVPGRYGRY